MVVMTGPWDDRLNPCSVEKKKAPAIYNFVRGLERSNHFVSILSVSTVN